MNSVVLLVLSIVGLGCSSSADEPNFELGDSGLQEVEGSGSIEEADSTEETDPAEDTDLAEETDPAEDTAEGEFPEEEDSGEEPCEPVTYDPNPFASSVVSYTPGDGAGFGQDSFPDIVLGPPVGGGEMSGSLDVLTLGHQGEIVLSFDVTIVDEEGPDLIVFENPFIGWYETGVVSASEDGETWYSWPCDPLNVDDSYPGCAGATPSLSHPDNCIDATDPDVAGGDHFDLADIGLESALFIRIQDSGANTDGGFDLDAVAVINGNSD